MITPLFKIDQDENYIIIKAQVKYIKISEFDYFIEDNNFRFTLKPYHLNIYLSDKLKSESENNSFKYDLENQLLTCKLEKLEPGKNFINLNLLSTLLENPKKNSNQITKIEEINSNLNNNLEEKCKIPISNLKELNEFLFNQYSKEENQEIIPNITGKNIEDYYYGFNNYFIDVFDKRNEDMLEICDINPKKIPIKFRYLAKLEEEIRNFDAEHYVSDLFLEDKESDFYDENFNNILKLSNIEFMKSISKDNFQNNEMLFNENELQILKEVNKVNLDSMINNLNHNNNNFCAFKFYLNIIDILFAFIYDCITTEFEHSSESGWTINKLSSTLSNLIDFNKNYYSQSKHISFDILNELIKNLIISCYRRLLIYPLYRNFKLCEKVKNNVIEILSKGKFGLTKCFIIIKKIFEKSEPRYLLNTLYINPLLKWIQFYSEEKIINILIEVIKNIKIEKDDLKLDLDIVEKELFESIED